MEKIVSIRERNGMDAVLGIGGYVCLWRNGKGEG